MVVISSLVRNIKLKFWTTSLIAFRSSIYMCFAISNQPHHISVSWDYIGASKFIQGLEIFIVSHWLTFIQQARNNCKLNKFLLILHCLQISPNNNGCKKSNIRDFILTCIHFGSMIHSSKVFFLFECLSIKSNLTTKIFFFLSILLQT